MSIVVIGINHTTAALAWREQLYFTADKLALYTEDVLQQKGVREAVLLSTCNRSELYAEADEVQILFDWFCAQTTLPRALVEQALYVYRDEEAIAHMMRVSCGLDSMVLGEPQILGQIKEAFSESCAVGGVDAYFHRLFQQVFSIAKEIRTTTSIGACPVSIVSSAVRFVKEHYPSLLTEASVMVIGAGEMAELLIRYLHTQLTHTITIVNRDTEKALAVMDRAHTSVLGLDQLVPALTRADIVFSVTGSAIPIVSKAMMMEVMAYRHHQPILIMDVAVPRDIDPAITALANTALYCLDDLKTMIEKNRQGREHAAEKAEELIRKKSKALFLELTSIDPVAHTIRAYRSQIERLCRAELLKAKQQLQKGVDADVVLEAFASAFIKKLLHVPSVQLRQAGVEGRFELLTLAKQLFAIPDAERL